MIPSVSESQTFILQSILKLHCDGKFDADITYGNGQFYKEIPAPLFCSDVSPQCEGVIPCDSTKLPFKNDSVGSIVFDPPFLTYIRNDREHGSLMAKRFGGYWTYDELARHYQLTLIECNRVLRLKGKLIFKCQDIINNHRMYCTHANVIKWAELLGYQLADMFILVAKNRMPIPQPKTNAESVQRHARVFHSYFLVLEKNRQK